jgi:hypothetical protein
MEIKTINGNDIIVAHLDGKSRLTIRDYTNKSSVTMYLETEDIVTIKELLDSLIDAIKRNTKEE